MEGSALAVQLQSFHGILSSSTTVKASSFPASPKPLLLCSLMNRQQRLQQWLQLIKTQSIRTIRFGMGRIVMHFEEQSIDAGGDGSARQHRNELWLPAGNSICRRWHLHRVRAVEDHRRELPHDGQGAHIDHQVVVAETCTSLCQEDARVPGRDDLVNSMLHIARRDKLALLHIDGAAGFSRSDKQVRLAAKKRGNLQNIYAFSSNLTMPGLMYIGEDGQVRFFGNPLQDGNSLLQTRAAKALHRSTVGFVIRSLENVGKLEIARDALDRIGHPARMRFTLNHTRPGDEEQRAGANRNVANFKFVIHKNNENTIGATPLPGPCMELCIQQPRPPLWQIGLYGKS